MTTSQEPARHRLLAFARKMNALPKVVLSRTLEHAAWNNTRIVRERVAETLSEPGQPTVA